MPKTPAHFAPLRKEGHASARAREFRMARRAAPSRMALEQPDDTPRDQRMPGAQLGSRQMA